MAPRPCRRSHCIAVPGRCPRVPASTQCRLPPASAAESTRSRRGARASTPPSTGRRPLTVPSRRVCILYVAGVLPRKVQRTALQHGTVNIATCNGQHCNVRKRQDVTEIQHATVSIAPLRKRQDLKFRTDSKIGCNGQHCKMQQAEPTPCNVATCCFNLQHAALLQPATRNTHNGYDATDDMHNGQHCNGRHCNLHSSYHATDRIATCNVNVQRTAVVPWYRAREPPARARVRRATARNGEGHFTAILNGSAAQCRDF